MFYNFSLLDFSCQSTANSAKKFSVFKDNFGQNSNVDFGDIIFVVSMILALAVVLVLINWFINRRWGSNKVQAWREETNPEAIQDDLDLAISCRAEYQLEIFNSNYSEKYQGRVLGREDDSLVLGLTSYQNIELDFQGQPASVRIAFKRRYGEGLEQYQFNTSTRGFIYYQEVNWREPAVIVQTPKSLITTQRRQSWHVEPVGDYALQVNFLSLPSKQIPSLEQQIVLLTGNINDISLGGFKCSLDLRPGQVMPFKVNDQVMIGLKLPLNDLAVNLQSSIFMARVKILAVDHDPEYLAGSKKAKARRRIVRAAFSGRYQATADSKSHIYSELNHANFQDLAYWLQAYQRLEIQKDRGTSGYQARL